MSLGVDDLALVVLELQDVKESWYSIGLKLKVEGSQLKGIKFESKGDSNFCLNKMLSKYLRESDAGWEGVMGALASIGRVDLVENIRFKFLETNDIPSGKLNRTSVLIRQWLLHIGKLCMKYCTSDLALARPLHHKRNINCTLLK